MGQLGVREERNEWWKYKHAAKYSTNTGQEIKLPKRQYVHVCSSEDNKYCNAKMNTYLNNVCNGDVSSSVVGLIAGCGDGVVDPSVVGRQC